MKGFPSPSRPTRTLLLAGIFCFAAAHAGAHAFVNEADPPVGGTVKVAPKEVRVWFSEGLNEKASSLKVFDAAGKEVDRKNVHLDPGKPQLLVVSLPALAPGTYKVVWKAVASNTHTTRGDFTFRVEG